MKRALILKAPGTNNDLETRAALEYAGAAVDTAYMYGNTSAPGLKKYNLIVIPGGFSFGDYLGAGKILALYIKKYIYEELKIFSAGGRIIVGICNGFQVLARLGFLEAEDPGLSFEINLSGRFISKWVKVHPDTSCAYFRGLPETVEFPVANKEGRAVYSGSYPDLQKKIRTVMTYSDNLSGPSESIAAAVNSGGNILGIMPHPERALNQFQHPAFGYSDVQVYGRKIFKNIVGMS